MNSSTRIISSLPVTISNTKARSSTPLSELEQEFILAKQRLNLCLLIHKALSEEEKSTPKSTLKTLKQELSDFDKDYFKHPEIQPFSNNQELWRFGIDQRLANEYTNVENSSYLLSLSGALAFVFRTAKTPLSVTYIEKLYTLLNSPPLLQPPKTRDKENAESSNVATQYRIEKGAPFSREGINENLGFHFINASTEVTLQTAAPSIEAKSEKEAGKPQRKSISLIHSEIDLNFAMSQLDRQGFIDFQLNKDIEGKAFLEKLLICLYQELAKAQQDNQKVREIACFAKILMPSAIFQNRANDSHPLLIIILVQKLLMECGLRPLILQDSRIFAGQSSSEINHFLWAQINGTPQNEVALPIKASTGGP